MSPTQRAGDRGGTGAEDRVRVLAVDDEPINLEMLERSLRRDYEVVTADDPESALELLRTARDRSAEFAVILSDYRMPGMSGAAFLAASMEHMPHAKRVIVTGYAEVDALIDAVNAGQIHYVVKKPWNHNELTRLVGHFVGVYRIERENRRLAAELRAANAALAARGDTLARSLDGAARQLAHAQRDLEILSYKDGLTGLYSHRAFQERLREEIARAKRYRSPVSVVLADIDRFRSINNDVGYQLGDEVLRRIAELMRGDAEDYRLRDSDVVARFGGEEFILILPETAKAGAATKADRLRRRIADTEFPGGLHITMSFGVAAFPDDAHETEDLIAAAQRALRRAKAKGRDQVRVFGDDETTGARFAASDTIERAPASTSASVPAVAAVAADAFPTYHQYLLALTEALELDRALNCLYIDLGQLQRVESEYGVTKHADVLLQVGRALERMRGSLLRHDDIVCRSADGDAYLCFLSAARIVQDDPGEHDLEGIAARVRDALAKELAPTLQDLIHDHPRLAVGYARVLNNTMVRPERLINRLVSEAAESAELLRRRDVHRDKALLQEIILCRRLRAVYQPIVHLGTGDTFGFEALTRGPIKTPLESPTALFSVADEVDLTFELDRECFRNALRGADDLEPIHRLFVNLLPLSFYDSSFVEREVGELLDAAGLTPANVVFEITERLAIENFASFRRALAGYTAMGFGVAIDDVGTRHSNLESVMALRPHFIKISDVLTRGVSRSTVKREMLRSLCRIAEAIDAVVVGEGIETPDDLAVMRELGVHYGQGFLLARPGPAFPRVRTAVRRMVQDLRTAAAPTPAPAADGDGFDDEGDFREDQDEPTLARGSGTHRTPAPSDSPEPSDPVEDDTSPHLV
ncbi:MAG: EAL domain-containing protein [Deltaproteobacteria bacterium]|nr:MAG: EAL domain-containing protein [Deltaproteobacteria bacterium]